MTDLSGAPQPENIDAEKDAWVDGGDWFDVAVLVEDELSNDAAQRVVSLYQIKSQTVRYHVVRPLETAEDTETQAQRMLQQSVERLEDLGGQADGTTSPKPAVDALSDVVAATQSHEAVVVTHRHWLASLLRRDWASQIRASLQLPVIRIVDT